jgi:Na+(H+)/acetate symporter ActP
MGMGYSRSRWLAIAGALVISGFGTALSEAGETAEARAVLLIVLDALRAIAGGFNVASIVCRRGEVERVTAVFDTDAVASSARYAILEVPAPPSPFGVKMDHP